MVFTPTSSMVGRNLFHYLWFRFGSFPVVNTFLECTVKFRDAFALLLEVPRCFMGSNVSEETVFKKPSIGPPQKMTHLHRLWTLCINASKSRVTVVSQLLLCPQSGVWPIPSFDVPFRLPAPLIPVIRSFNKFHQNRFTGRRLTWIFQLGSVDVKLNFVKRPVIATMNVQQLAICFAFNDMDVVSFSHLRELTQMTDDHLDVNVDCLVQQQLVKRYDDMEDGPSLMLNLEYAPKKPRIKISVPQTKEQPQQEKEETERSTGDMRQVFLQVRLLRSSSSIEAEWRFSVLNTAELLFLSVIRTLRSP